MNPLPFLARLLPRRDDHVCPAYEALVDTRAELAAAEHASEVDGETIAHLRAENDNNLRTIDHLRSRLGFMQNQRDRAITELCRAKGEPTPDEIAAVGDEAETWLRRIREGL